MTKKKIYQRPAIELCESETEEQLLALSSVRTTGLDKEESLDYGDTGGNKEKNIWDEAW
jgi:hypothetical protein